MKKTKTDNQLVFSHRIDSSVHTHCIATHLSSGPGCTSCTRAFSLIELMIVIVILGALTAIIVPMFSYSETNAKEDAVTAEMAAIRRAYLEFYNDNFPKDTELGHLANYGLYPLVFKTEPKTTPANKYPGTWSNAVKGEYDHYNDLGWNGPYLVSEGVITACVSKVSQCVTNGTQCVIPVVFDPYHSKGAAPEDSSYYRIIASAADTNKLSLICTGRNKRLQTFPDTTNDYQWVEAKTEGVDTQGDPYDDVSIPLNIFTKDQP